MKDSVLDANSPEGNRQAEASRSSTSGIEVENATVILDERLMGMAEDDGGNSDRQLLELCSIVDQEELRARDIQCSRYRDCLSPGLDIDIAADGGDRRDPFKFSQDFRGTDVAGMKDVIGTAKSGHGLGSQESVGVRNNANVNHEANPKRRSALDLFSTRTPRQPSPRTA